ncbi:MAG: LysM peptidoglycan-binding domain-containing protein [Deltaproteobacteria bacterium]|jgi:hypothetical protein|nr:LysM peptidoglycan-binding domain-containing protein [Deltaproteobacteria bacterium]
MNVKIALKIKMWLSFLLVMLMVMPYMLSAAEGERIIKHETGFYYTVQKGDTLWDLSRKFSDSAWLWPEMWRENSQIANPHRIYPGERIRLFRRTGSQATSETDAGKKAMIVPPSLEDLIHYNYTAVDRVGFVRKQPVPSHGAIFKVLETKEMISTDDTVYIRPAENMTLVPGKRYTIYRTLPPIRDLETNEYIGIQHLLTGVVEINQVQPTYAVATVIEAYRPIYIEDNIMPYYRRLPDVVIKESPKDLHGQVFEAEDHNRLIGDNMIAFIDIGKKDGVQRGQLYNVYYRISERLHPKKRQRTTLLPVELAEVLVLHTEDTTATVIVTSAEREFEPGSKIRSPIE